MSSTSHGSAAAARPSSTVRAVPESAQMLLAVPLSLSPSEKLALRQRLPACLENASNSLALAVAIAAVDPEGALVHLMNVAEAALHARAAVTRSRNVSQTLNT